MKQDLVFEPKDNSSFNRIVRMVDINGVTFDESFLAGLIKEHMSKQLKGRLPTISDAFEIYIQENPSSHRERFVKCATRHFNAFKNLHGDLVLDDLRHWHITQYRDYQLARGLNPSSVRKHNNTLNAMLNVAFKHLDIDRLSPFRALKIKGEGEIVRPMPIITRQLITDVKDYLLKNLTPHRLVALVQLNTGMRLSEPVFSRLEDCVLDHDIPHLWVRKNSLCDRKTKSSIRAVPLYGVSLFAAKELVKIAKKQKSEWLVPHYARDNGNTSCSAIINKTLRPFGFRSHMFRHALIDRLKACNDVPTRLAESITGHSSGKSEFHTYGTIGYTLEQKLEVIKRITI
jgi:integrase